MAPSENPDTVIEQTDSGESHFILRDIGWQLAAIREEMMGIRSILQAGHDASEALRAEARTVLEAHAESAQQYMQVVDQPTPPDFEPFVTMPGGTVVRDLPDGGRLFTLADGVMIRVGPDGRLTVIALDGSATLLDPARGGVVTLPDGRELTLKPEAVRVTHEAAGIEGLPLDIEPVQTAQDRYRVELPGGYRLDVFHSKRTALLGNPSGTSVMLGISRTEGVDETVEVRLVPGGAKGFAAMESGHKGVIEADGTIHVAMANGLDLVIHFPDDDAGGGVSGSGSQPACICEERD